MIRGVNLRLPVYQQIFPVCCRFFTVIHSWAFVHQSSMFRVVDVLCHVLLVIQLLKMNGFSCRIWIFPVCHFVYIYNSWSDLCVSYIYLFIKQLHKSMTVLHVPGLRSARCHQLSVPRVRRGTFATRAFSVAGPTIWNSLPDHLRDPAVDSEQFCRESNTYLFAGHSKR